MPAAFPHLFSPLKIGAVTLKNRIVSTGHDTVMTEGGLIGERLIAYHQARAKGQCGLIIVQVAGIHDSARYSSHVLMCDTDAAIPGYRRLAETLHAEGTTVFAQLFHPGREIMEGRDGTIPVAWSPSAISTERFHIQPRELTRKMIRELISGYAAAAYRLKQAGLRRLRDRREPRLSPCAVPEPARQPSPRRIWRPAHEPHQIPQPNH